MKMVWFLNLIGVKTITVKFFVAKVQMVVEILSKILFSQVLTKNTNG